MAKETIAISFEAGAELGALTLELDDAKNGDSSSFPPGATAWIRAITAGTISDRGSSRGAFQIDKNNLRFSHEQDLIFANTDEASLTYPPNKVTSALWIGRGLGNVTVIGKTVKAADSGYGILRVAYTVAYVSMKLLNVANEGPVLAWATDSIGASGYVQVQFGGEGDEELLVVTVKDICTGLPIGAAQVEIAGIAKGTTDNFGRLALGNYPRGTTQAIRTTAAGYKDSDLDALANDAIEVQ